MTAHSSVFICTQMKCSTNQHVAMFFFLQKNTTHCKSFEWLQHIIKKCEKGTVCNEGIICIQV